jgi:hypothetical protein
MVNLVGSLLHLNQEKQFFGFLRLRHATRHLIERHSEVYKHIKTIDPRFDSWFPPVEALRKEFPTVFTWATAEYKPTFYPDKVTLFWDEAQPILRRRWQRMAEGKDGQVEVHIMPGSHTTCKTVHLDGMAELLQHCLLKVQKTKQSSERM